MLVFLASRGAARAVAARAFSSAAAAPLVTFDLAKDVPRVGVLTLNNPAKLNALSVSMGEQFSAKLRDIAWEEIGALVITGAGSAFSAGGDFAFLEARAATPADKNAAEMRAFYARLLQIRNVPVPTIAAINGHAVGAGLCFALATDLRVASSGAKLGVNFSSLGIHPGMGGSHLLPRAVG
jgi:enoyl-CoA hydratase